MIICSLPLLWAIINLKSLNYSKPNIPVDYQVPKQIVKKPERPRYTSYGTYIVYPGEEVPTGITYTYAEYTKPLNKDGVKVCGH